MRLRGDGVASLAAMAAVPVFRNPQSRQHRSTGLDAALTFHFFPKVFPRTTTNVGGPLTSLAVPRREKPTPLLARFGKRVKELRLAAGLTLEEIHDPDQEVAERKGYMSSVEHGLGNPGLEFMRGIAKALHDEPTDAPLRVRLVDLVNFPEEDLRALVIERTRTLTQEQLREILERYGPPPPLEPRKRSKHRHRATGSKRRAQ
jgi:transcriptional regulator with XRE-family HTH domain